MKFLALDFETANYNRDSACSIGLVLVEDGKIIKKESFLIKPPSRWFTFTDLHGISYNDVADEPDFGELWDTKLRKYFRGVRFIAAHNAPFDRSVLYACCERYGITPPKQPFECTLQLARGYFGCKPANLPAACQQLKIPFSNHHDALCDSEASAKIIIKAMKKGLYQN